MKLANKAFILTLLMLTLVFTATAQNLRSAKDPRNTAPTVGGGGATGGPTGLFTVYDGQTLRKGEYTLSAGISNYDRDPGNVDFTTVPLSFQVGLTDNIELFFGTEAYRGVKVNSRRNLSSNYLPNSQFVTFNGFQSGPAIVLAPRGPGVSQFPNAAVYRPPGSPFVQYPFIGGNAGTYGFNAPFFSGPVFGFGAGTNAQLGVASSTGGGADLFPGIGSVYGSILPGVVLQTIGLTNAAGGATTATAPTVFTLAPTYVADAPFVNRSWGTSAFNSYDIGAKVRLTNINSPIGFGFVAYYRFYADKADGVSGFNQLQRGASPGGNKGDVGAALFADARLAKWANLSANVEYVYTSAVKGQFPGGTFTLLDRGDELRSSIGVDFPVNKYFQPIAEFRSLQYVGGRTPNAFEVDPIDGLIGARVFPRRWFGFSAAYRINFNQQDNDSFSTDTSSTSSVLNPCRIGQTACVPQTINTTVTGRPSGFQPSSDPHGFIGQFFIGRRDKRQEEVINLPANVTAVNLSDSVVTLGCPSGTVSENACNDSQMIKVSTSATDPENDPLVYNYTVSGGRIVGSGANVDWDMSGVRPGTYTITTGVDDGCGVCGKTETKTVTVEECTGCRPVQTCDCASLSVDGPSDVTAPGTPMTFTAILSKGDSVTYNWSVSAGRITSGQGTSSIMVDTTGLAGSNVTATVELGGLEAGCNCPSTASDTAGVQGNPDSTMTDEFGPLSNDDVKARVDNFYIQLNNDPSAQGYIINYGTAAEIRRRKAQLMSAIKFRKYDVSRVTMVDSITDGGQNTKFYLVPAGADNPNP